MTDQQDKYLEKVKEVETKLLNRDLTRQEIDAMHKDLSDTAQLLKRKLNEERLRGLALTSRNEAAAAKLAQLVQRENRKTEEINPGIVDLEGVLASKKKQCMELKAKSLAIMKAHQEELIEEHRSNLPEAAANEIKALVEENVKLANELVAGLAILESAKNAMPVTPDKDVLSLMTNCKIIREQFRTEKAKYAEEEIRLKKKIAALDKDIETLNRQLEHLRNG